MDGNGGRIVSEGIGEFRSLVGNKRFFACEGVIVRGVVTGEGQKTSSVLSRALSRIERRFRQRQSNCLTEVGVKRKSYCP